MAALDYTFDSFMLPAPNSLLAFCFCNVIIAILFLASSRSSNSDHDHDTPSVPAKDARVSSDDVRSWHQHDITTAEEGEATEEASASVDVLIEENSEDQEEDCGPEEEEEDDDELRRRVEEFIAKVNQGWKAEHLRR